MATVTSTLKMFDAMTRPLQNITQGMNLMISTMQQMQSVTEKNTNIDTALVAAKSKIADAEADIKRSIEQAESAQRNFNNEVNKSVKEVGILEQSFSSLATKVGGVVATYMGINKIKDSLSDLFATGVNFHAFRQGAEIAFTTFLGDAQTATQYMDDMYAFAKTTPFGYPELLTSARNLIAFGIEAKNTLPIMKAIGDVVAGIGGGNQELMGMADVFGAIQVSGNLSMMEVNRLGQYGVNALDILAKKAGKTAEEMKKQISSGAIGAGYAIATLAEGMDKQFGGLMEGIKGTWAGTIDSFKSAWRNAGADLMGPMLEPLTLFVQNVTGLFKQLPTLIGPSVAAFEPFLDMLNNAFDTGSFEPYLTVMSAGLTTISWLLSSVGMGAIWVAEVISEYWPIIATFLLALGASYIPMIITGLQGMITALLGVARGWLAAVGPIGWVIIAVGIAIGVMKYFGVTTEQIMGFIGGLWFALGATIWNVVANVWNILAMLAEFLINLFIDPKYAVEKIFYDMTKFVIDNMTSLAGSFDKAADVLAKVFVSAANIAIGGINGLIKALNMIPGVDIGEVGKVSAGTVDILSKGLKDFAASVEAPTSSKNVVSIPRATLQSLPEKYNYGYSAGTKMSSKIGDTFKLKELDAFKAKDMSDMLGLDNLANLLNGDPTGGAGKNKKPNVGKVDKVGKIEDTVDISNEDLKLMRELAEMKSIQNFVTLTPQVSFGDMHVKNESDIDEIIGRVEEYMENEIARSAEGVYS